MSGIKIYGMLSASAGVAVLSAVMALAQGNAAAGDLPLPDPGYELYYHDSQAAPNAATRWGYHDGWQDGRRDRGQGKNVEGGEIEHKEHYLTPPAHGTHGSMTAEQYRQQYRAAYIHGYKHGVRI